MDVKGQFILTQGEGQHWGLSHPLLTTLKNKVKGWKSARQSSCCSARPWVVPAHGPESGRLPSEGAALLRVPLPFTLAAGGSAGNGN